MRRRLAAARSLASPAAAVSRYVAGVTDIALCRRFAVCFAFGGARASLGPIAGCDAERKAAGIARRMDDAMTRGAYARMSAQMFCAQANAYLPSSAVGAGESPPDPGTVSIVFLAVSYWCTDATCTLSVSLIML